jgi:hypothetical protein
MPEILYAEINATIEDAMSIISTTKDNSLKNKKITHLNELKAYRNEIIEEVHDKHPIDTYVTLMQHFILTILGDKKFSFSAFKEFLHIMKIDGNDYIQEEISIQLVIEASIIALVFRIYYGEFGDSFEVHLRNPNKTNKFVTQCVEETGQENPDLMLNLILKQLITFYDVKTYTINGVGKQTISLFQGNNKTYKQKKYT